MRIRRGWEAGQATAELLMTAALVATLVAMVVTSLAPLLVRLVVAVVNHMAVFLTSV